MSPIIDRRIIDEQRREVIISMFKDTDPIRSHGYSYPGVDSAFLWRKNGIPLSIHPGNSEIGILLGRGFTRCGWLGPEFNRKSIGNIGRWSADSSWRPKKLITNAHLTIRSLQRRRTSPSNKYITSAVIAFIGKSDRSTSVTRMQKSAITIRNADISNISIFYYSGNIALRPDHIFHNR